MYIRFGTSDEMVMDADGMFEFESEIHWFQDPFIMKMIEDVDKVTLCGSRTFVSPISPCLPARRLSTGLKTLILMYYNPQYYFFATNCGDNCAKWILEIGKKKDVRICLTRIMNFGETFDVVLETGEHVYNMIDLMHCFKEKYYDKFVHQGP